MDPMGNSSNTSLFQDCLLRVLCNTKNMLRYVRMLAVLATSLSYSTFFFPIVANCWCDLTDVTAIELEELTSFYRSTTKRNFSYSVPLRYQIFQII